MLRMRLSPAGKSLASFSILRILIQKKNIMEFIGLLFEILFLLLGIFVYRLSTGKMNVHEMQRPAMERFIKENGNIMRLLSLALIAIMTVEVLLHIFQMFKK